MTIKPEPDPLEGNISPEKLTEAEYAVAVICHHGDDDGVVRVLLPHWVSLKVAACPDEERKLIYDSFLEKFGVAFNAMLEELD